MQEPPGGPPEARGGAVVTVGKDVSQVERRLAVGLLVCPGCGGGSGRGDMPEHAGCAGRRARGPFPIL